MNQSTRCLLNLWWNFTDLLLQGFHQIREQEWKRKVWFDIYFAAFQPFDVLLLHTMNQCLYILIFSMLEIHIFQSFCWLVVPFKQIEENLIYVDWLIFLMDIQEVWDVWIGLSQLIDNYIFQIVFIWLRWFTPLNYLLIEPSYSLAKGRVERILERLSQIPIW
jgi:hypothetical protein